MPYAGRAPVGYTRISGKTIICWACPDDDLSIGYANSAYAFLGALEEDGDKYPYKDRG